MCISDIITLLHDAYVHACVCGHNNVLVELFFFSRGSQQLSNQVLQWRREMLSHHRYTSILNASLHSTFYTTPYTHRHSSTTSSHSLLPTRSAPSPSQHHTHRVEMLTNRLVKNKFILLSSKISSILFSEITDASLNSCNNIQLVVFYTDFYIMCSHCYVIKDLPV